MKKDKIIRIAITIFIMLLPFLDMLRTTSFKDVEVFGVALIELVNIVLVGIALLLTLTKVSLKRIIALIIYLVVVTIYIYLHYKNVVKFDTNIYALTQFSFIRESFYILRVYILPLMFLYVLVNNRDIFNKEYYFRLAKYLIVIISFSIVILDIFKLSFISYNEKKYHVLYNIFDYFLYSGDYKQLAARGFFDSANELSAILLMLMPINIYLLYKEGTKFNVLIYVMQFVSMILLGTRTAAYGALLVSIVSLIVYILLSLLKKIEKNEFFETAFGVCLLSCTAFLVISPFMLGRINDGTPDFSIQNSEAYEVLENVDLNDLDSLIEKYKSEYLINEVFLEIYPIGKDPDFWLGIIKRDKALNNDSRLLKTDILNRIYERNNNPNDRYLGMGYTLNFIDLERDYYYQFYLFGIVGLFILMGPYFIVLGYLIYKAIKNFNINFNFHTILSLMSVLLGLLIAYYSGHVFGWVSPMMILVFVLGIFGYMVLIENNNVKKKVKR